MKLAEFNFIRFGETFFIQLSLKIERRCGCITVVAQQADKYIQIFNRLDYLFKVVEITGNYRDSSDYPCFASDFVEDCIKEIQDTMTIPEETEQSDSKGN